MEAATSGSMAPVAVPQPSSSLVSSEGGLVTATDLATDGDVERPQSSGLAMDIHVPGKLILTAIKLVFFSFFFQDRVILESRLKREPPIWIFQFP
jgi:hypothetical protein